MYVENKYKIASASEYGLQKKFIKNCFMKLLNEKYARL